MPHNEERGTRNDEQDRIVHPSSFITHPSDYGPPGSPIPGSLLLREYCRQCGLAIRVPTHAVGQYVLCLVCDRDRREHRPSAA